MNFELNNQQLCEITEAFESKLREGLAADARQIKCLPCFTPIDSKDFSAKAHVLDLGGSNLRAAEVDLENMTIGNVYKAKMPWQRGEPMAKQEYLKIQAELLSHLKTDSASAQLGYCFSYPARSLENGDAELIRWTKGIIVPDTEGHRVGSELLKFMKNEFGRDYSSVAVVNDTVTSLLSGLSLSPRDAYAGLIVGTGMNLAGMFSARHISKLEVPSDTQYPVNLESGNFHPPHLSEFDDRLDIHSENPAEQRFEKAVSGMYLGRIFALAHPNIEFEPESGAEGLVGFIESSADNDLKNSAISLYKRSAQLVAAQISGLASVYRQQRGITNLRVVAEGGLAHSAISSLTYFECLNTFVSSILQSKGLEKLEVEIVQIDNANLIGAAIAASQC
jgi:hexokinase